MLNQKLRSFYLLLSHNFVSIYIFLVHEASLSWFFSNIFRNFGIRQLSSSLSISPKENMEKELPFSRWCKLVIISMVQSLMMDYFLNLSIMGKYSLDSLKKSVLLSAFAVFFFNSYINSAKSSSLSVFCSLISASMLDLISCSSSSRKEQE